MWYVCYIRPNKAIPVTEELRNMGVLVECPTYSFRRRIPRRNSTQLVRRPLIGGIFFCHQDSWPLPPWWVLGVQLSEVRRMQWMGRPALLPDYELDSLRLVSAEVTERKSTLELGDRVEVVLGPFKGHTGEVSGQAGERAWVELDTAPFPILLLESFLKKKG